MKLFEFFGEIQHDFGSKESDDKQVQKDEEQELSNKVFWFIIDEDTLFKKYVFPLAKQIRSKAVDGHDWKVWLPLANAGCLGFYKEEKLDKNPKELFSKEFRKSLASRLADHYYEDILKDQYGLGN